MPVSDNSSAESLTSLLGKLDHSSLHYLQLSNFKRPLQLN